MKRLSMAALLIAVASALWSSGIIPAIVPAAVPAANKQGNGSLFQLSTGSTTTNHCAKFDAGGNTVDAGAGCASGSGTVTNVSVASVPAWLTGTFANPTTTPALTVGAATGQTSHEVIGTCGSATSVSLCALTAGDLPANQIIQAAQAAFDGGGSAVALNSITYTRATATCTVTGWSVIVDTGTTTVDVLDIANSAGGALPTSSITGSATPNIASGNQNYSTTLTGWSTTITALDVLAFKVTAVSGATKIAVAVLCNKT